MTSLWSYLNRCRCNTSPGALEPVLALAKCRATSTFECLAIAIDPKDWPDAAGASNFSCAPSRLATFLLHCVSVLSRTPTAF